MFELRPFNRRGQMTYNPFREMDEFEKRFFGEPFNSFFRDGGLSEFKTDIKDEGDSFLLEADLPGFDKKDIHLDLNDGVPTIQAERHSEHEEEDKKSKYVRVERSYGQYSRQFDVSGVDTDNIKAKYDNGVLKVTLPKQQTVLPEPKRLEIE